MPLIVLALLLCMAGCQAQDGPRDDEYTKVRQTATASLAHVKSIDPVAEANRLADAGRFEFRGVYGASFYTPGVGGTQIGPLSKVKVVPIQGTSDGVFSDEQTQLNQVARVYARSFNRQMLLRMRASRPPHPATIQLNRQLDAELRLLEKGDASANFRRDLKTGRLRFIVARELRWEEISGVGRDPQFEKIYYKQEDFQ